MEKSKHTKKIRIQFDQEIYHQGDVVSGKVILELSKNLSYRAIRIQYVGYERTECNALSYSGGHAHSDSLVDRFYYYSGRQTISGKKGGGNDESLGPGHHEFSWKPFVLPSPLPPNFKEGKETEIAHAFKACVDIAYKFDIECVTTLPVDATAVIPKNVPKLIKHHKDKTFVGSSDGMSMYATLLARSVLPGADLPISLKIQNNSQSKSVKKISFKLNRYNYYRCCGHNKVLVLPVSEYFLRSNSAKDLISPKSCFEEVVCIRIPAHAFPSHFPSELIHVRYAVEVEVVLSGVSSNCHLFLPDFVVLPATASPIPSEWVYPDLVQWNGNPHVVYPPFPLKPYKEGEKKVFTPPSKLLPSTAELLHPILIKTHEADSKVEAHASSSSVGFEEESDDFMKYADKPIQAFTTPAFRDPEASTSSEETAPEKIPDPYSSLFCPANQEFDSRNCYNISVKKKT